MYPQSQLLFERSKCIIPGGVNSPVRAFGSVGGTPLFIQSAKGSRLVDVDGRDYVDFINSWGPMILGHQFDPVIQAVQNQLSSGVSYGCPTEAEHTMASVITEMAPWVDQVRLTSSGTEACMSALRAARGYTGKNKFIKFAETTTGHADPFLVKAGSGLLTLRFQVVRAFPRELRKTLLLQSITIWRVFLDILSVMATKLEPFIIEPVAGNMGCIPPQEGFLEGLRELCDEYSVVLIFDEVMTGFRMAPGGAAERLGVKPDVTTFGKVIGGGLPVGAFGGKAEIMNVLAPKLPGIPSWTLSGNPIATASGIATLTYLKIIQRFTVRLMPLPLKSKTYSKHDFQKKEAVINRLGSMISVHFGTGQVINYNDATKAKNERFNALFHHLLKAGCLSASKRL